jgi:hypothetical protein
MLQRKLQDPIRKKFAQDVFASLSSCLRNGRQGDVDGLQVLLDSDRLKLRTRQLSIDKPGHGLLPPGKLLAKAHHLSSKVRGGKGAQEADFFFNRKEMVLKATGSRRIPSPRKLHWNPSEFGRSQV